MTDGLDHLDQWESAFERRSIGRTRIIKGVLLFFSAQTGVRSCAVTDNTKRGRWHSDACRPACASCMYVCDAANSR